MEVQLITERDSDLAVVNAARTSFDKVSTAMTAADEKLIAYLMKNGHWSPASHVRETFVTRYFEEPLVDPSDYEPNLFAGLVAGPGFKKVRHSVYGWSKLLLGGYIGAEEFYGICWHLHQRYPVLARELKLPPGTEDPQIIRIDQADETDPQFIDISLRVKAPIFIARQAYKHKIGFVENEVSRRYVSSEPEFYWPKFWRKAAENVKQGSSDDPLDDQEWHNDRYEKLLAHALDTYEVAIKDGMPPEQARMILPQSMMTTWIWTGSLLAFSRFYNLRAEASAQREIQDLAKMVGEIIEPLYPYSWKALTASKEH